MGICLLWCVLYIYIYNANVHFLIFILYFCQIMLIANVNVKIVNLLHFHFDC
jgi:hypothetical protein